MGKRQGIMLATPFTARHFKAWHNNVASMGVQGFVYGQRKLNGERMKWQRGRLVSSEANPIDWLPTILDELMAFFPNQDLDGEAYIHGWSRQRIHSVVSRTANVHEDEAEMEYHVFDIPSSLPQVNRISMLEELLPVFEQCEHIKLVPAVRVYSVHEAQQFVQHHYLQGFEGGVFRNPLAQYYEGRSVKYMMKWKPNKEDEYVIISVNPGRGKYEGTLGSLTVQGSEHLAATFNVGSFAVSDAERDYLWRHRDQLIGGVCRVRFTELTDAGIPPSGTFLSFEGEIV